ncbi:MAG: UTP--glucose-1-phosphate uridylyltransferase GalU [Acidimicrobiales bacterium]|nr:UTP--glucose-1-phosphate uridylyltransferase GalU [Acidimicrobiales bacterium]
MKQIPQITKAVIPAAGLGTRFLPATKAQPKEMLPVVDKPAIQYVVEESVDAGLRDILVVTGRGKRSIEDHFDRSFELEHYLEIKGRQDELNKVQEIAEMANLHYLRQGSPKGLGDAVSVAKDHTGEDSFAVLLADDLMDPSVGVLRSMLAKHRETGFSIIALKEVLPEEISLYGSVAIAKCDFSGLVKITSIVEKPSVDEAPSNFAVMGRYVFTPTIYEALKDVTPGKGGELQLTDGIAKMLDVEPVYGYCFTDGRYDIGNKLDYLRATLEIALNSPDIGTQFAKVLTDLAKKRGLI